MTKEEKLDWLYKLKCGLTVFVPKDWVEPMKDALADAIEALEQKTREDAVSRDAVIKAVDKHSFDTDDGLCLDDDISIILEDVPSVSPEPCGDCISRQDVIDLAEWFDLNKQHFNVANLIDEVENMPSVQPKPKTGHWITKPYVYGVTFCSECNFELKIDDTNYCPNCGAKMEGCYK